MLRYCFNCNKKREVKAVGEYSWKGKKYPIFLCRWCRAANTKRKNMSTDGVGDKNKGAPNYNYQQKFRSKSIKTEKLR